MDGEPHLVIGKLSIWVTGRSLPDAADPWDAEENLCHAVAIARGARVELSGSIPSRNLLGFVESAQKLYDTLSGTAWLDGTDFGLVVKIEMDALGHLTIDVEMLPDHHGIEQSHRFSFRGDQTELVPIIRQCRAILARLPVLIELRG